jgi:hypothetical protein
MTRKHERKLRRMKQAQARLLRERAGGDGKPGELSSKAVQQANAKRLRKWREGLLGKFGAASAVRRIDPATGEVIEQTKPEGKR